MKEVVLVDLARGKIYTRYILNRAAVVNDEIYREIITIVANYFKLTPETIFAKRRFKELCYVRAFIHMLGHRYTFLSSARLAMNLDHASIFHSRKALANHVQTERTTREHWINLNKICVNAGLVMRRHQGNILDDVLAA